MKIDVQGDAQKGWLVHVHDGDNAATYSPESGSEQEAAAEALRLHGERFAHTGPAKADEPEVEVGFRSVTSVLLENAAVQINETAKGEPLSTDTQAILGTESDPEPQD